jgi:excisionase family DNA binding protein
LFCYAEVVAEEITVQEAAQRTSRSPETIRRWIWSGRLPAVKRGNTYYVDVVQLEGVAVEMGTTWHHAGKDAKSGGDLATWLDEVDRWQAGLPARASGQTASDLVIEDRRARR